MTSAKPRAPIPSGCTGRTDTCAGTKRVINPRPERARSENAPGRIRNWIPSNATRGTSRPSTTSRSTKAGPRRRSKSTRGTGTFSTTRTSRTARRRSSLTSTRWRGNTRASASTSRESSRRGTTSSCTATRSGRATGTGTGRAWISSGWTRRARSSSTGTCCRSCPRPRPTTTRCSEPGRLALRNRPEIECARSCLHRSLRRPGVAEPIAVGDDARSGRELAKQLRQKAAVERLEEEQRHHRGFADIGLEQVAAHEAHAVFDTGAARVVDRHAQRHGVDLDADAACSEVLRRGDDDAPVAAAQVVDHVLRARACELEHSQNRFVRAREIRHLRVENRRDPVGELRVAEPVEHGAARHEQREAEKNEPGTDHGFRYGFFGSETVVCPRFPKSMTAAPTARTPRPTSAWVR